MVLKEEVEYYNKMKLDLITKHEGKYALIKGQELKGIYNSEFEAYEAGVKMFKDEAFLIKHITKEEETVEFPALALGIIYAHS